MKPTVNVLLVEDEEYNLLMLKEMLHRLRPNWHVAAVCDSVKGTVAWLKDNPQPDLLFMDIQLADGLCFSIFEMTEVNGMVIFTTAYDNYAIRAFKVNSIDYLLKPFKDIDLETAINKFEKLSSRNTTKPGMYDFHELMETLRVGDKKYRKRFLISKGSGYVRLDADHIAYFYNTNRITTAVTFDNHSHVVDFALDTLEEQLDPDVFFRANRQLLVSVRAVERIENYFGGKLKLKLNPPLENDVLISRLKSGPFRQWLGQ